MNNKYLHLIIAFIIGICLTAFVYPSVTTTTMNTTQIEQEYKQKIEALQTEHETEIFNLEKNHKVEIEGTIVESSQREEQLRTKISQLTNENTQLAVSKKEDWVKVTHPDGTIEEHKISSSEVTKLSSKIASMEQETQRKVDEEYKKIEAISKTETDTLKSNHERELVTLRKTITESEQKIKELQISSETVTTNIRKFGVAAGYNYDLSYQFIATYDVLGPIYVGSNLQISKTLKVENGGIILGVRF